MAQLHIIKINGKPFYFHSPEIGGAPITFPPCGNILISYMRKHSKNRYEVVVAYKNYYAIYGSCASITEARYVLQTHYNG